MAQLDPRVNDASPSLYAAAYYSNLSDPQIKQINQISNTVGLNRELMNQDKKAAIKRYSMLDPHVQDQLKSLYGEDAPYMPKQAAFVAPTSPGAILHDVVSLGKGALNIATGPIRAVFKVAGEYNRAINTPYLVYRQVQQGANPMDIDVWRAAWDGTNVFDNRSLAALHEKYGDTDTFVAMQALQGRKPGEILDAYGKVNSEIIGSLTKMLNEPDKFEQMINDFKGAQVSYGRDIARALFHAQPTDSNLYSSSKWNKFSGGIDLVAQLVIDPLNFLSFGTFAAASKGEKLAALLMKDPKANVAKVFADPQVRAAWEKAGPLIERLDSALKSKNADAAMRVREEIRTQLPSLNNYDMMDFLAKYKVFTPERAEKFFSYAENMKKLVAGSVDGTTFFRSGVPIAKRSTHIASGINKFIGDYFNGAISKTDTSQYKDIVDSVAKIAIDNDPLYKSQSIMLEQLTGELRNTKRRIGRMFARFPGSEEIFVTDAKVSKTIPVVRNLARTIYPKIFAEYFAESFRMANQEDRVILLKGLYIQIMHNMGLHATENGRSLMQQILQDKFADTTGFMVTREASIPPQFADEVLGRGLLEEQSVENVGGLLQASYDGPIHPFQSKPSIGNLPWHGKPGEPSLANYAFDFSSNSSKKRALISGIGGATRNHFVTRMVDNWSTLTLFPRLGIRSSIDEMFFYLMVAPGKQLMQFAQGRKLNKAVIAFSGDDSSIPPLKKAILNKMGKNPASWVDQVGKEGETGRFFRQNINGEEIYRLQKAETIATQAVKILKNFPQKHQDYMYQAMIHHPEIANSMVNSIIGKSGIGSTLGGGDLASMIISNSNLTKMYKDLKLTKTGRFTQRTIAELERINESAVAAAHFDNWFIRFTKNGRDYGRGNINFGTIFMRHNALRTADDFKNARAEMLKGIGIDPESMTVKYPEVLNKYLSESQQFARDKARGWSEMDTAVKRVEMQLLDMYQTFHGSAIAWNDRLYNKVHELAQGIKGDSDMSYNLALKHALDSVDFAMFEEYTKGFRPLNTINTDIDFSDMNTAEGFFQKMNNWKNTDVRAANRAMEWMDAQNNFLFRQPALWSTYTHLREKYANMEKLFIEQQIAAGVSPEMANTLAEKAYTEIAMNHAANMILKSVDNPKVRSNISWSLRTTGRYYRATEDFYRRVFRLKDMAPQVLYRLRLAHIGFQSNGFIHPDENGDPYLVMPADNLIFHAINGGWGVLTGNEQVIKQPMWNDFALKISMSNPSFQQDAGQPSLSGPFAALPILGMKNLLNLWGGDFGKKTASRIDKLLLGNVNENLDLAKAIIPSSLQRAWNLLPKGEQDQQTVSAAMQAIAYNAANGLFLSPEMLAKMDPADAPKAIADYKKNVLVSTHNILFMRNFLGLLSPISPTMQESTQVPDYLKNLGINSLRPEFADILQSVMRNSRGDIQDPYGAALMAFTGKYPGKLVYTVARDKKTTGIIVNKTKALKDWMLGNDAVLKRYPSGAGLVFAPNIGDYDSGTYAWMQASGLLERRSLDDYFNEVAIVQDRQKYYDLRSNMEQQLLNPSLTQTERRYIIERTRAEQDLLKQNNPYLDMALSSESYGIGKQEKMLYELEAIIKDTSFPISDGQRKKMGIAVSFVRNGLDAIKSGAFTDILNGTEVKQEMKQQVLAAIRELGGATGKNAPADPVIREALRSIFEPILDFYVRNTQKVSG